MNELIAALEGAEEGSRGLDAQIAFAANTWKWSPMGVWADHDLKVSPGGGRDFTYKSAVEAASACLSLPHYTTSIDAALTLVPEGWCADLCQGHDLLWLVELQPTNETAQQKWAESPRLATPALALCIAAIKARQ